MENKKLDELTLPEIHEYFTKVFNEIEKNYSLSFPITKKIKTLAETIIQYKNVTTYLTGKKEHNSCTTVI